LAASQVTLGNTLRAERRPRDAEPPLDLAVVIDTLPILADLLRCDVTLFHLDGPTPVGIATTRPQTVPSVRSGPGGSRWDDPSIEPAILNVFDTGRSARRLTRQLVQGTPTVQDVFPVSRDGRVVAALACEMGVIEHERQRRRSPIYRRALESFRVAALEGRVHGATRLSRLGEHDGPFLVDAQGQIIYISSVAESIYRKLGYGRSMLHQPVMGLTTDESGFQHAIDRRECMEYQSVEGTFHLHRWAIPVPSPAGPGFLRRFRVAARDLEGVILIVRDETEERFRTQELLIKSALIQEIHHRVKNNLQTVAALLRLQARRSESTEVHDILRQTINRILSIAVVHEFLAHDQSDAIDVKDVCQRLVTEVSQSQFDPDKSIRFRVDGSDFRLPAQQATSCALIVNELLQNSVKHAFVGRNHGTVTLLLDASDERCRIVVVDDGCGVGPGFETRHGGSLLGLHIVRTLVREDLRGELALEGRPGQGLRATITFAQHPGGRTNDV